MLNIQKISLYKLDDARKVIKKKIPDLIDIVRHVDTIEYSSFLQQIADIKEDGILSFAWAMKSDKMGLLFHILACETDKEIISKVLSVINVRKTKRLYILNWLFMLENVENKTLWDSLTLLTDYVKISHADFYRSELRSKIGSEFKDFIQQSVDILNEENTEVPDFFKKYSIDDKSEFALGVNILYFTSCEPEKFLMNFKYFIEFDHIMLDSSVMKNYMNSFKVTDFADEVMLPVFEKYGADFNNEEYWSSFKENERNDFFEWVNLWKIKQFLLSDSRRASIWRNYYRDIINVVAPKEANILFIYFQKFVIVIPGPKEETLYLYKKNEFINKFVIDKTTAENEAPDREQEADDDTGHENDVNLKDAEETEDTGEVAWQFSDLDKKIMITAREALVDDKVSSIYMLSSFEIGILYINELLNREITRRTR